MKRLKSVWLAASIAVFGLLWNPFSNEAKAGPGPEASGIPKFRVDPLWPTPLPNRWITGEVGGTCVDAEDHVFIVNRTNLTAAEQKVGIASPPVIEFDQDGKIVNSWGNPAVLPGRPHTCYIDYQGNFWIAGNRDAVVQKYTRDGSKMLLQIGTKGQFDTSDGTMTGGARNSSHTLLNNPADIAVDPANGDVYIADGYGNKRVVVFDREGHFLRQWGQQATKAQIDEGIGGVFFETVHRVVIGNDGLVYVCDREGGRVEVFDKMGNFKRNIFIESKTEPLTGPRSAGWIGFSPDPAQKFMYVSGNDEIRIIDHATGHTLWTFGQPGHQAGEFEAVHTFAVDSKGDIITGEVGDGRRVQMFRLVGN